MWKNIPDPSCIAPLALLHDACSLSYHWPEIFSLFFNLVTPCQQAYLTGPLG